MIQDFSQKTISTLAQKLVKIISGFVLMFACSQITIPLQPVSISLQTVGVMLIGLTYNKSEGIAAMVAYIFGGAIGLPVFANFASGITSPSSGYLFGFIAAIYCMNKFKERFGVRSFLSTMSACILGSIIIFTVGIAWLSAFIGFSGSIIHGLLPFIIPGLVKVLILSGVLKAIGFRG